MSLHLSLRQSLLLRLRQLLPLPLRRPSSYIMHPGPYNSKYEFFGEHVLLAQGVQFFVVVPMVHRGTLGVHTAAPTRTCVLVIGASLLYCAARLLYYLGF
jgi:hypothetical protein